MGAITDFVSQLIGLIIGSVGSENFYSSLLLAPFVFWVIRQVFSYFHMLISQMYKSW